MEIRSLNDLRGLIPEGMDGEALNYGQGEGQWRIGSTVWGIYIGRDGYYVQLEEGTVAVRAAARLVNGILKRVRSIWGERIQGEIEGLHHRDSSF